MHPMLNIAVKAARRAAQIINRASLDLDLVQVSKKQHNDFVTEVDKASEAAIIDTLKTAYPDHAILAEESGKSDNESEYQWIIDPLDGTTNFIHGFQYYCVSIALAHKGIVTQAVVYDPNRNDLFTASRGRGAFLNDRRIRVGRRDRLADGLIGTGFPFRETDGLESYGRLFKEMTEACAGLRRPGAAALDLANVAAGRLDGFFGRRQPADHRSRRSGGQLHGRFGVPAYRRSRRGQPEAVRANGADPVALQPHEAASGLRP
jgi:myo-inositol-1(or 4)-monophosphatase